MVMSYQLDPQSHEWAKYDRVIVFDGVCNWCNASVNFTMDHDPEKKFKFGTLQSEPGQKILEELQLSTKDFSTFLLIEKGKVTSKSTAGLRVVKHLSGLWPLLYACIIIPRPVRDAVYNFIARHRYQWMGKTDSCRVPNQVERERFV